MQTEKGVIYRNSDGTQKNLETELGLKANTTGTYPNLSVGNATNATNATKATQDGNGNTITTYYLPKNGPDLVVGQTLSALISGKSYLDCSITATISSGTYYFYNCMGTVTVSGTSAKVYAENCPNLTINGKTTSNWQNIWIDGVASQPNGVVTQYSNGTMIISETIYPNTSGTIPYTFPVSFAAEPATTMTALFGSRYVVSQEQSATSIKFTVWNQEGQTNAEFVNIHAIGRWK